MKKETMIHSKSGTCKCPYCKKIVGILPPFCEHLQSMGRDGYNTVFKFIKGESYE